jgi:hypothetical protein
LCETELRQRAERDFAVIEFLRFHCSIEYNFAQMY